jgi:alpha-glucosidase
LLLLALPGTAFLYEGQELGLEEVELLPGQRQDPIFERTEGARLGRDGCRVPMPWTRAEPGFGFGSAAPWLPQPPRWGEQSVEVQLSDPGSVLMLVRAAIDARPHGAFAWQESPTGTLSFERDGIRCVVNVEGEPLPLEGEVLLSSEPLVGVLRAGAAAWLHR